MTQIGAATPQTYNNDQRPISWSGGTPTATGTNDISGIQVVGIGNGFGYATPTPVASKWFPDKRGLVVGLTSELSTLWFSAEFKTAFALGALILVLLVRPQGIIGVRQRVG